MEDFTAFRKSPIYRGNIHCHSTVSDGALPPQELVRRYKEHGWSFLALSEHNTWSDYGSSLDSKDFITIPAMELSVLWYKEEEGPALVKAHHIQLLADHGQGPYKHLETIDFPKLHGPDADFVGLVQAVIDAHKGMVIGINHPSWSRVLDSDLLPLSGFDFLEVYNNESETWSSNGLDCASFVKLLDNGHEAYAVAADDNHNMGFEDSFGGWIQVDADGLDSASILTAIKEGRFHSSTGPMIHNWGIRDGHAFIHTSPVHKISLHTGPGVGTCSTMFGDGLEQASFGIPMDAKYIRFEAEDGNGGRAWTNAHFIKRA